MAISGIGKSVNFIEKNAGKIRKYVRNNYEQVVFQTVSKASLIEYGCLTGSATFPIAIAFGADMAEKIIMKDFRGIKKDPLNTISYLLDGARALKKIFQKNINK